jgi:hypothetical protein
MVLIIALILLVFYFFYKETKFADVYESRFYVKL